MSIIEKALDKIVKENRSRTKSSRTEGIQEPSYPHENIWDDREKQSEKEGEYKDTTHISKKVSIDFNKLNENGFITPNSRNHSLFEQLRHIKMQLIQGTFAQGKIDNRLSNIFLTTSAVAGEGKTYASLNLALSIAYEFNYTVLYIDADPFKLKSSKILGVDNQPGLVDYLSKKDTNLADYILSTNIQKFKVIPAGKQDAMTTELFSSKKMEEFINQLSKRYNDRLIIIDAPPLLEDTSAAALTLFINRILFVVEAEKTPVHIIKNALRLIKADKSVSIILNKSNQKYNTGYSYYYA